MGLFIKSVLSRGMSPLVLVTRPRDRSERASKSEHRHPREHAEVSRERPRAQIAGSPRTTAREEKIGRASEHYIRALLPSDANLPGLCYVVRSSMGT